jgi:UDP-N-acetylmuramate--alanine ligase
MFQGRINHLHFVGIGGSGMNGIAEVLINMGFTVTGSDLKYSATIERLENLGGTVYIGHAATNIQGAHVLIKSTAIPDSNIEVMEAKDQNIPVIPRAEMLAELMRMKYGIAVAGTHGKTTTTSMLALCLHEGDLDPTIVIGGRLDAIGSSAKLGHGEYLVAEADESDGSFMMLSPTVAIITNIDPEHLEYWGSEENLINGFIQFAQKVPFFGFAVLCLDHTTVQSILPQIHRRVLTYGFSSQAEIQATNIRQNGLMTTFSVQHQNNTLGDITINMPGEHNINNALAAIATSIELNIPFEKIQNSLNNFGGVNRRFSIRAEGRLFESTPIITVIDDYGHHPVEIRATLLAARQCWPNRRIIAVFQPHRYSRVRDLFEDFCRSFNDANHVVVCPVYRAGEAPIENIDQSSLALCIKDFGHRSVYYVDSLDQAIEHIQKYMLPGDVIITLGAGNVNSICEQIGAQLDDKLD